MPEGPQKYFTLLVVYWLFTTRLHPLPYHTRNIA
jgi:hypothetical protein